MWAIILVLAACVSGAAGQVVYSLPVKYVRFSRGGYNYMGFQEVQIFNAAGTNMAAGCSVTASGGMYQGSPSSAVDGAWSYAHSSNDMLVTQMGSPWIELDLGTPSTTLISLKLYIDYIYFNGDPTNWFPGDTITFFDSNRNGLATWTLPSSWGSSGTMPYVVDLAALFLPFISPTPSTTPSTTSTPTTSPSNTPTPTNTPNPSCLPSAFRLLPGSDLVGDLLSTSFGATPYEHECALICCSTDSCQGYTWANPQLLPSNPCNLLTNVTAYTTNHMFTSGVLLSSNPSGAPPL